mmetsp:Transcript_24258/g.45365  ORF Transcript_24258/g.45365 Transcript_24258/m.45365 type:complete len:82 (+) Transcript_24258:3-248(+)
MAVGSRALPLCGGAVVCALLLLVSNSYAGTNPSTLRVPTMRRSAVSAPQMGFTGHAACQRLRSDVARRGVNDRSTEQKVIF